MCGRYDGIVVAQEFVFCLTIFVGILMKFILSFCFTTLVLGDMCEDTCTKVAGLCGSGSSFCRNGYACDGIFKFDQSTLCYATDDGCVGKKPLTCYEAVSGHATFVSLASRLRLMMSISLIELMGKSSTLRSEVESIDAGSSQQSQDLVQAFKSYLHGPDGSIEHVIAAASQFVGGGLRAGMEFLHTVTMAPGPERLPLVLWEFDLGSAGPVERELTLTDEDDNEKGLYEIVGIVTTDGEVLYLTLDDELISTQGEDASGWNVDVAVALYQLVL